MKLRVALAVIGLTAATSPKLQAQTFSVLHTFSFVDGAASTNADGAIPQAGLLASGGSLYGTTLFGGTNGNGAVFTLSLTGDSFAALHSFGPTNGTDLTNSDGMNPLGGLVISGSTLYGTAANGGTNGSGTVFSVNTDSSGFKVLHTFAAVAGPASTNADGWNPASGLALSGNTLYGTAFAGGTNGSGTVFSLNTNGSNFTVLHTFGAVEGALYTNADGADPQAALFLSGGTLAGTTVYGGTNGNGTIFAVSTNGSNYTVLHTFTASGGPLSSNMDGWSAYAGLVGAGGMYYGTANLGGTNGTGTVFALGTNGSPFTVIHTFSATNEASGVNADGANPFGGLALSGNTLYGTAQVGGTNGGGAVFSVSTNGINFSVLHTFSATSGALSTNTDGVQPWAGVVLSTGALYGTAVLGGTNANGTVFSLPVPAPPVTVLGGVRNPDGSVTINFAGGVGYTYVTQSATNLGPAAVWQNLSTNVADGNGLWQFTDPNASHSPAVFYRSSTP